MPHLDLSTIILFANWTLFSLVTVFLILVIIYPLYARVFLATHR